MPEGDVDFGALRCWGWGRCGFRVLRDTEDLERSGFGVLWESREGRCRGFEALRFNGVGAAGDPRYLVPTTTRSVSSLGCSTRASRAGSSSKDARSVKEKSKRTASASSLHAWRRRGGRHPSQRPASLPPPPPSDPTSAPNSRAGGARISAGHSPRSPRNAVGRARGARSPAARRARTACSPRCLQGSDGTWGRGTHRTVTHPTDPHVPTTPSH